MTLRPKRALPVLLALSVLGLAHGAAASPLLWDVDETVSSLTVAMPDQVVTIGTTTATIRIRNQSSASGGNNVWNTGNTAFLDGQISTDYTDGSSIEFLGGSTMFGLTSGNYRPNPAAFNPTSTNTANPDGQYTNTTTAAGVYGARVRASISIITVDAAFINFTSTTYDVVSSALAVSSGNFAANVLSLGFDTAVIAFDGLNTIAGQPIPDSQGSLVEDVFGTNASATGTITSPDPINQPNLRRLSIPVSVPVVFDLQGTLLNASASGSIVAYATLEVPEPGTLALLGAALLGLAWRGRRFATR